MPLLGCWEGGQNKASVLVIAFDHLPFGVFDCELGEEGPPESGFRTLCRDSVRFTHAFTTSPQSVAALASIMTGLLPVESGVRSNVVGEVRPSMTTLGELALAGGYHTFFASGGPPITRRTGLSQGFEVFTDTLEVSPPVFLRSLEETIQDFLSFRSETQGEPFMGVLYAPDLRYVDTPKKIFRDQPSELSYRARLADVDEWLGGLFVQLRKRADWDSTNVVLVGLNGLKGRIDREESEAANLYGENVQVVLMIKPSRQPRDEVRSWTVDTNVSLIDLHPTLLELMNLKSPSRAQKYEALSVVKSLRREPLTQHQRRPIVVESGWTRAFWGLPERSVLIDRNFSVFFEHPIRVFNLLIDRYQQIPLPPEEIRRIDGMESWIQTLGRLGFEAYVAPDPIFQDVNTLLGRVWGFSDPSARQALLEKLGQLSGPLAKPLATVGESLALALMEAEDWRALLRLGRIFRHEDLIYLAEQNLGLGKKLAASISPRQINKCVAAIQAVLQKKSRTTERACESVEAHRFLAWIDSSSQVEATDVQRDAFFKVYSELMTARRFARLNYRYGGNWDISPAILRAPTEFDLAFFLPDAKTYRHTAQRRLAN